MSDTDGKKTLGLRGGARPGNVKQSFSHGRTKNVVVETKRKRVVVPKAGAASSGGSRPPVGDPSKRPAGISDAEMDRRLKAVQAAKAREVEEEAERAAEEKARAEDRERRRAEIEAKEREEREREESLKAKAEEEERLKKEAEAAAKAAAAPAEEPVVQRPTAKPAAEAAPRKQQDRDRENKRGGKGGDDSRRSGKLTLNQALAGGEGGRQRSMAAMKRKQERARQKAMGGSVEREKVMRDVQVPEAIVVSELANRM
ncbi:MAG: translation initiation factor IF-2 associated domain-containing protein, partial [Roseobacter sp.]|nr:translation initiation factor IF-2 associated domain-containing protein [Roseobacter sp.]